MDAMQKGIVTLLKSAVLQQPLPLPENFSLEEAFPVICRHHVTALAFEGGILCGISRQDPTMVKLFQYYCKGIQTSEGQMQAVKRLEDTFQSHGIDYLPLKGCVMKSFYPKPELRAMGDADILIREEQYERIVPLIRELGYTFFDKNDCHASWSSDLLHLELHRRLLSRKTEFYSSYFGSGWQMAVQQQGTRYAMSAEDTFLFLFMHFTKHYMWSGIGCRHVVDLWVYLRSHPQLEEGLLRGKLEELRLTEFYGNLRALLDYWFEDGPASDKLEYMTQFIFSCGSWGFAKNDFLTEAVRNTASGKSSSAVFFLKKLFPGVNRLSTKYEFLNKAPWLLPVAWVMRFVQKLSKGRWFARRVKEIASTVNQESIDQRRAELRYVGLEEL